MRVNSSRLPERRFLDLAKGTGGHPEESLARTAVRPCKVRSECKKCTGCTYMHVQNVFLHYHYHELLFPYGYHTTMTERSVLFLSLRENNTATAQVEGKWHFLTMTLSAVVLTLNFPLHHHGRQVTQGRNSALSMDYTITACPKQGGGDVSLHFILSCSPVVSHSCKTQLLWLCSSEVQRHGFTEVAHMPQDNCMIRVLWVQMRSPPSGFALPFHVDNVNIALSRAQ